MLTSCTQKITRVPPATNSAEPVVVKEETLVANEVNGEEIFFRFKEEVCETHNACWQTKGYLSGSRVLQKEFVTDWGKSTVIIIPIEGWEALTDQEKVDFEAYLQKYGLDKVIVGRVVPARYSDDSINPDRNKMTVDKTVWTRK